jgi:glycosyltransferase involved in cell wall biosynthesis
VPVLASNLPEIRRIVESYNIGMIIENHEPAHIAAKMTQMLENPAAIAGWKENLNFAASELCWENEKKALIEVYQTYA